MNTMRLITLLGLALSNPAWSQADEGAQPEEQFKAMSGMSVLGNNEAPKSLVIVPWKSSEIGDGIGVVDSLDGRPMPVDRDVFARELDYYQIRTDGMSEPRRELADDPRVGIR